MCIRDRIKLDEFVEKKLETIDLKEQLKIFIKIGEINKSAIKNLEDSKLDETNSSLKKINELIENQIENIEVIDRNDLSINIKGLIENITLSQERYASSFGKNQTIRSDSIKSCLLYTSPSPRDRQKSRMPSSA